MANVRYIAGLFTLFIKVKIQKKTLARDSKKKDALKCHKTVQTVIIFVELQKVLLSTSLNASDIYYKTI